MHPPLRTLPARLYIFHEFLDVYTQPVGVEHLANLAPFGFGAPVEAGDKRCGARLLAGMVRMAMVGLRESCGLGSKTMACAA